MRRFTCLAVLAVAASAGAVQPSFFCDKATSAAEKMICADDQLAQLDRQLALAYASALTSSTGDDGRLLEAEQRSWVKQRDGLATQKDGRALVKSAYERRIADLQARFKQVRSRGPVAFICDANPATEVAMMFFESLIPTARVRLGNAVVTLFASPTSSGPRYEGQYEGQTVVYAEHRGETSITWGGREMKCRLK